MSALHMIVHDVSWKHGTHCSGVIAVSTGTTRRGGDIIAKALDEDQSVKNVISLLQYPYFLFCLFSCAPLRTGNVLSSLGTAATSSQF